MRLNRKICRTVIIVTTWVGETGAGWARYSSLWPEEQRIKRGVGALLIRQPLLLYSGNHGLDCQGFDVC